MWLSWRQCVWTSLVVRLHSILFVLLFPSQLLYYNPGSAIQWKPLYVLIISRWRRDGTAALWITVITNFMELSPSREAASCAATQDFPAFYGTLRFITVFIRALHRSLSSARSVQSVPPYPISLRSILILSTHLRHGLLIGLFLTLTPIFYMHSSSIPCVLNALFICPSLTSSL
jgi:hypothetical protein